jgi:hypothetical protein
VKVSTSSSSRTSGEGQRLRWWVKSSRRDRREIFLRIVELCRTVVEKNVDPFEVDVVELFEKLKLVFTGLRDREELYLDVEAVLGLSDIVMQQGEWVKHRSSLLYFDPLLTLLKVEALTPRELVDIFAEAWHPIVDLQQLTSHRLREAMDYWMSLSTLRERAIEGEVHETEAGLIDLDELASMGYLSEEEFISALKGLWEELKESSEGIGWVSYWDFIDDESFEGTIQRAYMVSLLCCYGYATMETKPLEEEVILEPFQSPMVADERAKPHSIPISLSHKSWKERRERRRKRRLG